MDKYKLRIPPTVYYDLLADVREVEEEQEPRKGHWKDIPKYKDIAWQCSECEHFTTMKHNFCPNCGEDMREVEG